MYKFARNAQNIFGFFVAAREQGARVKIFRMRSERFRGRVLGGKPVGVGLGHCAAPNKTSKKTTLWSKVCAW